MRSAWRRRTVASVLLAAIAAVLVPNHPALAAEYELASVALYEVRPDAGDIGVSVGIEFTNTTPDPAGRFSVFDELRLAIHDQAADVVASDGSGDLDVAVADVAGVMVATIDLREGVRYEESVELELAYRIVEDDGTDVRVGPQLVVFPAWGFGTSSVVDISVPPGFEVRIDGDGLEEEDGILTSGPIEDPTAWLAIVTALGPAEYSTVGATVPLDGGTADVLVRAFADDPGWAESTRDLVVDGLPWLEREIGLPYPQVGQLVITQGVPGDGGEFGEGAAGSGEIVVAHDQPPFTVVHQLAHLWLAPPLVESRWIAEGLASDFAAAASEELGLEPPYDPAAEAERLADAAQPLDSWDSTTDPAFVAYAHARSWALVSELRAEIGDGALRAVLARTAASIGPYDGADLDVPDPLETPPRYPLTSRTFLDQLEAVTDADASGRFGELVFSEADAALLPERGEARASFEALIAAANGWGAPDAVRAAMTEWRFADAEGLMTDARDWLVRRDDVLAAMERAGLSRPERLIQAYRAYGGGPESVNELEAEAVVVEAYAAAAERINEPRSFLARLGLVGGADPATELDRANGLFADGDLRGAMASIEQAQRLADSAETSGVVRVASLALLVVGAAVVAVVVFRRRAAYTAPP
jgi:hypothetical protein